MSHAVKRCDCPDAKQNKCPHSWYMTNFIFKGTKYAECVSRWAEVFLNEEVTTRTRAEEVIGEICARIRRGPDAFTSAKVGNKAGPKLDPAMTIDQLITKFDDEELSLPPVDDNDACSEVTLKKTRAQLRRFADYNGNGSRPATDLEDPQLVVAFRTSPGMREQGRSSWAKYRSGLDRLLIFARRLGIITKHPFEQASKNQAERLQRKDDEPRSRRLKTGEETKLFAGVAMERCKYYAQLFADIIIAALESAGRIGELRQLRWFDIDLPEGGLGVIMFPAKKVGARKNRKPRLIPVSDILRAVLVRRRLNTLTGQPYPDSAYIFGNQAGERMSASTFHSWWKKAVVRMAGHAPVFKGKYLSDESEAIYLAQELHFHDLRREAASRWLESGLKRLNLKAISKMLGHSNIQITSRYLQVDDESVMDAMRDLNEQRRREAAEVAQAQAVGSGDHKPTTNENQPEAPRPGPRLVRGRKSGEVS